MASRKKAQRKLKQSSLLDGLERYDRLGKTAASKSNVTHLEDSDPYKFEDSQSMEPGNDEGTSLSTTRPLPRGRAGSSHKTPTPGPASGRSRKGSATSTPVQQHAAKSKRGKNKRSPAALTEQERLQLQEEEDYQRALEASMQDMERMDRKRKREKALWSSKEQGIKLQHLQKQVEKTMAVVDSAKNLQDGRTLMPSSKKFSVDLTTCIEEVAEGDSKSDGTSTTAAAVSDIMCEDPPTLTTSPSPPLTPPMEPVAKRLRPCSEDSLDATPPLDTASQRGKIASLSLSKLSSVTVKKLSVKKSSGNRARYVSTGSSSFAGSAKKQLDKITEDKEEVLSDEVAKLGEVRVSVIPILVRTTKSATQDKESQNPSHTPINSRAGDSPSTPLLIRNEQTSENKERNSTSSKSPTPGAVKSATPSLTSVPGKVGDTVPGSDCSEIKEASKQVRRNLSLSYSKKQGTQKQQFRIDIGRVRKSNTCNETIEIVDVVNETKDCIKESDIAPVESSKLPSTMSDLESTPPSKAIEPMDMAPIEEKEEDELLSEGSSSTTNDLNLIDADHALTEDIDRDEDTEEAEGALTDADSDEDSLMCVDPQEKSGLDLCNANTSGAQTADREQAMETGATSPHSGGGDLAVSAVSPGRRVVSPLHQVSDEHFKRMKFSGIQPSVAAKTRSVLLKLKLMKQNNAREVKDHPPPPTYAPGDTAPAEYSKVIQSSFNSYFSQLSRAQRKMQHRVQWGKQINSSTKQPPTSLTFTGRKNRSARSWLDDHLKLSLKIASRSRSTPSGELFRPGFLFSLSEDEGASDVEMVEGADGGGISESQEGASSFRAGGDPAVCSEGDRQSDSDVCPSLVRRRAKRGSNISSSSESDTAKFADKAVLMNTEEGVVAEMEEGHLSDDNYSTYCAGNNSEPILIGTQEESGPAEKNSQRIAGRDGQASRGREGRAEERITERDSQPSTFDQLLVEADPEANNSSDSLSSLERNIGSKHEKFDDKPPQQKDSSPPWLNSRKPPPPAKRTPKIRSKKPKASSTAKARVAKGRQGRGGKGSAAARLILRGKETTPSKDGGGSGGGRGKVTPDTQSNQSKGKTKRIVDSSSEGSDDEVLNRREAVSSNIGSAPKVIDLTEDSHKTTDNSAKTAGSKHSCPICRKLFYESEIEVHVNQCLQDDGGEREDQGLQGNQGRAECGSCGKEFESSLLAVHEEQCDGQDSSNEEDIFPIKRRRLVGTTLTGYSSRASYQTTMADFQSPHSSENEDIEFEDVTEISGTGRSNLFRGEDRATDTGYGQSSRVQPQAIRCEDGGYVIDPTSISSSPIRSFTRLEDMDPEERVRFQNQFRTKGRGRGRQQLLFQQHRGRGSSERDSFDELRDGTRSSKYGGSGGGKYYGKKIGQKRKTYWKKKASRK